MNEIGHNSINSGQLTALVERIEKLEDEKKAIGDDVKGVYAEAAGHGYDRKILRRVIALRRQDKAKRDEEEAMLVLYLAALNG